MTDEQLAAVRDALIAELDTPKSSAAKFAPALQDWRNRNGVFGKESDQSTLDRATNEVRQIIKSSHERAVANMRAEFQRPDRQKIYGGKTPEELQALFIADEPIYDGNVVIGKSPSPLGRCWSGIPYTYNVPPIEVIKQALS